MALLSADFPTFSYKSIHPSLDFTQLSPQATIFNFDRQQNQKANKLGLK
jgi:hypothetical protein